jgi:hypothetical protein
LDHLWWEDVVARKDLMSGWVHWSLEQAASTVISIYTYMMTTMLQRTGYFSGNTLHCDLVVSDLLFAQWQFVTLINTSCDWGVKWGFGQLAASSRSNLSAALRSVTAVLGISDIDIRTGVHWSCYSVSSSLMNHIPCTLFINIHSIVHLKMAAIELLY